MVSSRLPSLPRPRTANGRPASGRAGRSSRLSTRGSSAWMTRLGDVGQVLARRRRRRPGPAAHGGRSGTRGPAPSGGPRRARPGSRAPGASARVELGGQRRRIGQRLEEIRRQHRLEQADMLAQMAGQTRRHAHQIGDQARAGADWLGTARTAGRRRAGWSRTRRSARRRRRGRTDRRARCSSRGISSVSSSRARASRVARMWPWCQARTRAATALGLAKPISARVARVSGSSSVPVNTSARPPPRSMLLSNSAA